MVLTINCEAYGKERGYSQEGLAHEIEIDPTYMGSVERGERNIAAINIIRIAKVLKIEVGDIFPSVKLLPVD